MRSPALLTALCAAVLAAPSLARACAACACGDPTLAVYGILGPRATPTDELIEALRGPADGLDAP